MQNQELFSSIPMRTWRWLGVNGAALPAGLDAAEVQNIHVKAGEKKEAVHIYREGGHAEIEAHVEAGGSLSLVKVQLVPEGENHADDVKVRVEEGGAFSYTVIEIGANELVSKLSVELAGKDAAADIAAFYFADKKRKFDFNYLVRQRGVHTDANMQVKGALMDEAQKVFRGTR